MLSWIVALFLLLGPSPLPAGPSQLNGLLGPGDYCFTHQDESGAPQERAHGCCLGLCQLTAAALPQSPFLLRLPVQSRLGTMGSTSTVLVRVLRQDAHQPRAPPPAFPV